MAEKCARVFERAGFSKRHAAKKIEKGDTAWHDKCETIACALNDGALLVLVGKRGTGKTQMVVDASKRFLKSREVGSEAPEIMYTKAIEVFVELRGSYRDDSSLSEQAIIKNYCRPQVLIIDEMHERGESSWEDRILTHIIDTRYGGMKDTILISNQKINEFKEQLGPSIMSRLTETGGMIDCDWDSFRKA